MGDCGLGGGGGEVRSIGVLSRCRQISKEASDFIENESILRRNASVKITNRVNISQILRTFEHLRIRVCA